MKYLFIFFILFLYGCGGTREYRLQEPQKISVEKKLPGNVNLKVFSPPKYQDNLGLYKYNIHLKDAITKQYEFSLRNLFENELQKDRAETNIHVTSLDTSIFPISGLVIDIRVFLKIEIFDTKMRKLKTLKIYGFGSAEDGNKALQKAVANSFHQLIPAVEELFVRS
ncbi:hypothetical protein [Candidatus Uabimicrobium sp. HlEnr_7]|uniref:hypothetical protein n=1 Tax=Candidatus Uabimicrobium helgolandensis TaxID=3095367 RepID=UPI0035560A0B